LVSRGQEYYGDQNNPDPNAPWFFNFGSNPWFGGRDYDGSPLRRAPDRYDGWARDNDPRYLREPDPQAQRGMDPNEDRPRPRARSRGNDPGDFWRSRPGY
jgi:hypothetical protein